MSEMAPAGDERPQILQLGPDMRGGMTEMIVGLMRSPLAERYRMEFVATHHGPDPIGRRLQIYLAALRRLCAWSLLGRGRIVHVHVTVRGSTYRKAGCVLVAKALRRRVVLHMHSGPGDIAAFRARLGPLRAHLFQAVLRISDAVLAVSAASASALEKAYGIGGVAVVPNAAPARSATGAQGRHGGPVRIVYLGGFENPVKGGETMLAALRRPELAGLSVTMAGPGELPGEAATLLSDAVDWRGWLEPGQRDELMDRADIFVLPSTSEGLPLALLEAMARGTAIVATEVGGVPDVLADGRDALLVPPGDAAALAVAIARLAGDEGLRRRLGDSARRRAERLNSEEVTGRLDDLYRKLLAYKSADGS